MREIKFRAWDTKTKHMSHEQINPFDGDYLIEFEHINLDRSSKDLIWMQYIGLKDKNGKEIYEGDIVNNVTYTFNGVVFFDNGSFWVRECLSHVDEGLYDDREKETRWSINLDWEVVGNIYETPELFY
jgi:uncharacterized phage protein (TIGR01671 family)